MKNQFAVKLGRLGKGVPHNCTPEQREAMRKRLGKVRKFRWNRRAK